MDKKKPRFLRRDWNKKSKLGRKRKKKQIWRKPKGRHNKLREKFRGKSKQPSIGYGSDRIAKGKINGMRPIIVNNVQELLDSRSKKDISVIISKTVGILKKIDIAKKAIELNIKIMNLDAEQFLNKIEDIKKEKKKEQEKEIKKKEEEKKDIQKEGVKEEISDKVVKTDGRIEQEKKEEEKREIDLMKKEVHKHIKEESKTKKAQKAPLMRTALEK